MLRAWKARIANSHRHRRRHHAFNFGHKVSDKIARLRFKKMRPRPMKRSQAQPAKTAVRTASGSALFLDRDGIVNVDRGYDHQSDQFELVTGIFDLARFWTTEVNRPIIIITNQSGIGRGYFDEDAYADLTRWMCQRFVAEQAPIAHIYHCAYHPEHGIGRYRLDHPWRNPIRE
jgi:HAD superfamily hydrolase (TIGR01662 family)